jgi:hypothetical protein
MIPNIKIITLGYTAQPVLKVMSLCVYHFINYGAVVNYNMNPIMSEVGSSIFLHLWRSANQGTAGCIAMSEEHLSSLLHWLDKTQHPYIYITDKHFKE